MTTGTEAMTWAEAGKLVAVLATVVTATWYLRGHIGKLWAGMQRIETKVDIQNGQVAENTLFRREHQEHHVDNDKQQAVAVAELKIEVGQLHGTLSEQMLKLLNQMEILQRSGPAAVRATMAPGDGPVEG